VLFWKHQEYLVSESDERCPALLVKLASLGAALLSITQRENSCRRYEQRFETENIKGKPDSEDNGGS